MISADSRLSTRSFTSNNTVALGFHSWTLFEICWTTPKSWGLQITVEVPTARSVQTWRCINISWAIFWYRFKCPRQFKFRRTSAAAPGWRYCSRCGTYVASSKVFRTRHELKVATTNLWFDQSLKTCIRGDTYMHELSADRVLNPIKSLPELVIQPRALTVRFAWRGKLVAFLTFSHKYISVRFIYPITCHYYHTYNTLK
jgi:hypothetical protein